MKYLIALVIWAAVLTPGATLQNNSKPTSASTTLSEVLTHMREHDDWHILHLLEYQMHRRFYAANPRFKQESVLKAKTRVSATTAQRSGLELDVEDTALIH